MGKCLKCGKSGLFLRIDNAGLCKDCSLAEEQLKAAGIAEAKQFVEKISRAFSDILNNGAHFPVSSGSWVDTKDVPFDCVHRLRDDCALICSEFPRWKEYPFFEEAFLAECRPNPTSRHFYEHPYIPIGSLNRIDAPMKNDFPEKISAVLKKVQALNTALLLYGEYEYRTCRVAGVSFKNDDGSDRQELLKKIRYRRAPYQADPSIRLEKIQYDGEDAVAVYANENQLGWVSKFDLPAVLSCLDRYKDVDGFSIHGGSSGGKKYGIDIRVRFYKAH